MKGQNRIWVLTKPFEEREDGENKIRMTVGSLNHIKDVFAEHKIMPNDFVLNRLFPEFLVPRSRAFLAPAVDRPTGSSKKRKW